MENKIHIFNLIRGWPELDELKCKIKKFPNGDYCIKRYGEYAPCVCFIIRDETRNYTFTEMTPEEIKDLGIDAYIAYKIRGLWWVSKTSGNICFRPEPDGEDIMIATEWGGPWSTTRGSEFESFKDEALYTHRAESKGGKLGNNYYVFQLDEDGGIMK